MPIVEIVGASGAGKSTLLTNLRAASPDRIWRVPRELKHGFALAGYDRMCFSFLIARFKRLFALQHTGARSKLSIFLRATRKLGRDRAMQRKLLANIIDGDPVSHYFTHELVKLAATDKQVFSDFVLNRVYVFLHTDPEQILANRNQRTQDGRPRSGDTWSAEVQRIKIADHVREIELLRGLLVQNGNRVLDVDYADPGLVEKTLGFVNKVFAEGTRSVARSAAG